jgi:Ca2+-binding EF-hand superfamily protein
MDVDGSGTVNQDEMRWALQRDVEIHALAKTSPLLRLLLKQRTRLEALFSSQTGDALAASNTEGATQSASSNELSWDEFVARCEHSYLRLMSEGLIQPDVAVRAESHSRGGNSRMLSSKTYHEEYSASARETEAQTIRRVFALLDIDQNGVLDVAEVQRALYNSAATPTPKSASRPGTVSRELRVLVEGSRALQPMLHQELFMTAFTQFEPLDRRGISEEEFVDFCLEIAHVAAANNMVTSVPTGQRERSF